MTKSAFVKQAGKLSAVWEGVKGLGKHIPSSEGMGAGIVNHFSKNKTPYLLAGGFMAGNTAGKVSGYDRGYNQGQKSGFGAGQDTGKQIGYGLASQQAQNTGFLGRLTNNYEFDPRALAQAGYQLTPAELLQMKTQDPNRPGLLSRALG